MTKSWHFIILLLFCVHFSSAQENEEEVDNSGYFSLGARTTMSSFSGEGNGLGTGGQFRVQLAKQVNTEWFADYIGIKVNDRVKSNYAHIGWSVMFYPIKLKTTTLFQPYVIAGHCFDYNRMSEIANSSNFQQRWGSAVQGGAGMHINITKRFDITFICQYMIHLTRDFKNEEVNGQVVIKKKEGAGLEGHLLTTVCLNYKIAKLWGRK